MQTLDSGQERQRDAVHDPKRSLMGAPTGTLAVVGENQRNDSKFNIREKEFLFSSFSLNSNFVANNSVLVEYPCTFGWEHPRGSTRVHEGAKGALAPFLFFGQSHTPPILFLINQHSFTSERVSNRRHGLGTVFRVPTTAFTQLRPLPRFSVL